MSERTQETLAARPAETMALINPFPGLRPFSFEESHLFFGREGQCDEILINLARQRFVAVIGASGSGKSSLMYCGLIPILYGGFVTEAGSDWTVLVARPGIAPIENLAEAIVNNDPQYASADSDERAIGQTVTSTILRSSSMGFADAVKQITGTKKKNIFLLVDQFEELFRFMRTDQEADAHNEAAAFVNLLIKSIQQTEVSIYVALTMRSDFIGDCSQFPELTHVINKSHYLIPQMTREQQRLAIEGPVAVGGGHITKRLVQQVLNDVGNQPDQLPVMQHALMRTWDHWTRNREGDEPLDLRHYIAIGKITEALSQHANEAYSELTTREKDICEVLFKALTEKGADNQGIRRAARLRDIADIASVEEEEVMNVVEKFREPGRSLLMPAPEIPLHADSIIEISHESLMRIWQRLRGWVDEEADSANMYRRLSEAATMYQTGKTGLWRPPDLQLALNWQLKQKPTRTWAKRYHSAFERAIVFLDTSKVAYENEQRSKELLQKRMLNRTRTVAVVLGIAAVISILFFVFGWIKKVDADNQRDLAEENRVEAIRQAELAEEQKQIAELQAERARQSALEAQIQRDRAMESEEYALEQRDRAEFQTGVATEQRTIAMIQKEQADSLRYIAIEQTGLARNERDKAFNLRMLSIAQSMSVKSLNVQDLDLKALLAYQAYLFNAQYGGSEYDNYIYDGLYYAKRDVYEGFHEATFNVYKAHNDMVRTMAHTADGNKLYTSGSDGRIVMWDLNNFENKLLWKPQVGYVNYTMKLSPDENWLVVGGTAPYILVINLQKLEAVKIYGHQGAVAQLLFLPGSEYFYSLGINDSTLRINDFANSSLFKKFDTRMTSLALSPDGGLLVGGDESGVLHLWNTENLDERRTIENITGRPVYALEFSPDGSELAIGDEGGVVYMCNVRGKELELSNALIGQNARINSIKFSNDGKLLATASLDGTVQTWLMGRVDRMLPMAFKDHKDFVWSIDFTADGDYLLAGTRDGQLKRWPTNFDRLAEDICKYLQRNMTRKEWDRYVGEDIDYRTTCGAAGATSLKN
jgi:ABC-type oligopeptide transport system ATPase subunit